MDAATLFSSWFPKRWIACASRRVRRIAHHQPLLILLSSTVVGILIDRSIGSAWNGIHLFWWAIIACGSSWMMASKRSERWLVIVASCVVMVGLGGLDRRMQSRWFEGASVLSILSTEPQPAILEAVIAKPCVLRPHPLSDRRTERGESPWMTQFEVHLERLRVGTQWRSFDGRLLVRVGGQCDQMLPGQRIRVYGAIHRREEPGNPGEPDLRAVDRRGRLHGRVEVDRVDQVVILDGQQNGLGINRIVAKIARRARNGLLGRLDEQSGPLAVALVIGQREFVDSQTRDKLLVTGTAHLLSVSGMHLAIVVAMVAWSATLLRMPLVPKVIAIVCLCGFYTTVTGARPPVVRAAMLVSVLMFAVLAKRPSQVINTLSLAGLVLVLFNPENVTNVGVQLSFLAVATLVLCGGRKRVGSQNIDLAAEREAKLEALADSARSWPVHQIRWSIQGIGRMVWYSGCVTATSLPLVWHQFHVVSPISVLANVALAPLLFLSLASGIATAIGDLVFEPVAWTAAIVCQTSLGMMRSIIDWAASIPGGHYWLPSPPTWWVVGFYLALAGSLLMPSDKRARSIRIAGMVVWIAAAYWMATDVTASQSLDRTDGAVEATFIDVGHGTSIVIRFSDDEVWLYDCGRLGNENGSSRDIDTALWSLGVTHLRGIVLSHADADHFNALPGLLRRFRVDHICTPPGMLAENEPALDPIRAAIAASKVAVAEFSKDQVIESESAVMRVLHPPVERLRASDNANSLVIEIRCGEKTLLIPGDLEPPGTEQLVNQPRPPPGSVLMAPHHGSTEMDAEAILRWARPSHIVVSGGRRASRPEVREMLEIAGSKVDVTDQVGAVRVRIDRSGNIDVRAWKASPW